MTTKIRKSALGAAALYLAAASSGAQASEGWDWVAAPYLWMVGVSTDLRTTVPPSQDLASESSFDDIIDKIDGAFQIHAEGQGDRFGVFADFTFLGLADEKDRTRFRTEADLDTRLFEIAGVWSPGEGRFDGLELFAGLRHVDIDLTLLVEPVNPALVGGSVKSDETFNDLMIGARYTWNPSERWGVTLRGDGSTGDTEGTWNASAVVQYRTQSGAWMFGYRYLSIDLEPTDKEVSIDMSGLMLGYGFKF